MRKIGLIAATIASIFVLFAATMGAATAQPADSKPAKESKLLKAQPRPTPKDKIAVYSTDATTGDTRFIGFENPGQRSTAGITGPYNPPRSGDFVLDPISCCYAAYGFSGTGTKTGTWSNRGGARSGRWYGYFYWLNGGNRFKSVTMAPNAAVVLSESSTVDQVTITG